MTEQAQEQKQEQTQEKVEPRNRYCVIGFPTYGMMMHYGAAAAPLNVGNVRTIIEWSHRSLLANNFNYLMCRAFLRMREDSRITHFCLHHADVHICTPKWLEKMFAIQEEHRFAALSVTMPIKTNEGLTSTAVNMGNGPRRITLTECAELPDPITPATVKEKFGSDRLLINTGLLLVDMRKINPLRHYFNITDWVEEVNGNYRPRCMPEDWDFSEKLNKDGLRYGATRQIVANHWGQMAWDNQNTYGQESDQQWLRENKPSENQNT